MKKDFKTWSKRKEQIEERSKKIRCASRDIWLCSLWVNVWNEIGKNAPFSRPVLILNDYLWWDLILIVPLTTKNKEHLKKFQYSLETSFLKYKSYIWLNQIKIISKRRLIRRFWKISQLSFDSLVNNLQSILFIK